MARVECVVACTYTHAPGTHNKKKWIVVAVTFDPDFLEPLLGGSGGENKAPDRGVRCGVNFLTGVVCPGRTPRLMMGKNL